MILGSGAVWDTGPFRADIFALALLTTLLFQVLSDYANDYGDAVKGTDDDGRLGPRRAIQTGQMSAAEMKRVIVATALLSPCSLALSVLALDGASIYAAIRYAVGTGAYGYLGLGDVFVFLFFGLLSMPGSYFYTCARSMRHCCCRHARAGC